MLYDIEQELKNAEDRILALREEKIKRDLKNLIEERNRIMAENETLKVAYKEELDKEYSDLRVKLQAEYEGLLAQAKDKLNQALAKDKYANEQRGLAEQERARAQELKQNAEKEMASAISLRETEEKEIAKIKSEHSAKAIALSQVIEENDKLTVILEERKTLLDNKEFKFEEKEKDLASKEEQNRQVLSDTLKEIDKNKALLKVIQDEGHVLKNNLVEIKKLRDEHNTSLEAANTAIVNAEAIKAENIAENERLIAEGNRLGVIKDKLERDVKALAEKQKLDAIEDRKRNEQIIILNKLREAESHV